MSVRLLFGLRNNIVTSVKQLTVRSHHPRSAAVTLAKTGNLICSLVLMVLFYLQYWLEELLERMYRHLKRGETFEPNVPPAVVLSEQWFWFEVT